MADSRLDPVLDDETEVRHHDEPSRRSIFGRRKRAGTVDSYDELPEDEDDGDEDYWDEEPVRRRSAAAHRPSVIFLNFLLTCGILGAGGLGAMALSAKSEFERAGPVASDTSFTVRDGASLSAVATDLQNAGLIKADTLFGLVDGQRLFTQFARLEGDDTAVKTGEFAIPANASMADILEELTNGTPIEFRVTIPEGLTVQQAAERIASNPELTGEMPDVLPTEGTLAAQTVNFSRGESRAAVLDKLQRLQAERVAAIWAERAADLPIETPEELLILASIVEKETGLPQERPEVAAVFANRLREGWHLNTDPSVVYGVYGGAGLPEGTPITKADLRNDNPYNTYIYRGLPPGPIAIPGEAALKAAANPAQTSAMYFVADGTGGHAFAETAEEHQRNVRRWRQIENGEIEVANADPVEEETVEAVAPSDETVEPVVEVVPTDDAAPEEVADPVAAAVVAVEGETPSDGAAEAGGEDAPAAGLPFAGSAPAPRMRPR